MSRHVTAFTFLIVTSILLIGCQQQEESLPEQSNQDSTIQVKNSDPVDQKEYSNQEIAQRLANIAGKVPNVLGATAIVAGPYAVVGIDVDKDLDRSRVGTIKYSVTEALYHDPYGKTAIVVADADGTERIRAMANKIGQGHPIQGIVDEVAAIVGRYMPELPISDNQPVEPDQNKKVIPEEEENKLENIEEDQSNHKKNNQ